MTNEIIKEMKYQMQYFQRKEAISSKDEPLQNKFVKRTDYIERNSNKWICRYWQIPQSVHSTLWEKWKRLKYEWDTEGFHCKTWFKTLKKGTIDAWKSWRDTMSITQLSNKK